MAFVPAIDYDHAPPHRLKLPWPWTLDIDKTFGATAHHYCPSKAYAKQHLQSRSIQRERVQPRPGSDYGDVEVDWNKFVVHVDVAHFTPDELSVYFTHNHELVIEGQHGEKGDPHGSVERHFKRRYPVPSDVNEEAMVCNLSSDGVLTVYVPREPEKLEIDGAGVKRSIPIQLIHDHAPGLAFGVGGFAHAVGHCPESPARPKGHHHGAPAPATGEEAGK